MEHLSKFSPSHERDQGLANMPSDVFHAGNRDGYGRNPRVLQQIASEGKRSLQLDKCCLHFLLILQNEILKEEEVEKPPTIVKGLIQHISAKPFYTTFSNEAGVRLYHSMANNGLVHGDATGSIVASSRGSAQWCDKLGSKRLLYYAVVVQHPQKGQPPIAVAEMGSSSHTCSG
jgi:hypothetical protein